MRESIPNLCYISVMGFSTEILALAALILGVFAWLRHDIRAQGQRLDAQGQRLDDAIKSQGARLDAQGQRLDDAIKSQGQRLDDAIKSLGQRVDNLATEVKSISERVSRVEGLLEGMWRPRPWPGQPEQDNTPPPRTGTEG